MKPFSHLNLSKAMLSNLSDLQYEKMTPIQEASIPIVLKGRDLLAQARTGSGKTAAFGIGVLEKLDIPTFRTQCLVLCPTRELSDQVAGEIRRIARYRDNIKVLSITGGVPMRTQEASLKHQAHIVVGTPGRILKLSGRGSLDLTGLSMFILDEADRMLDMGFEDEIRNILDRLPAQRQTLCFSATFPEEIRNLGRQMLNDPREISAESFHNPDVILQRFYQTDPKEKTRILIGILSEYAPASAVIFCNTKDACRRVGEELNKFGLHSLALHGDLDQRERTEVLIRFANRSSRILVATDVASRGLDIESLGAVINYEVPFETETYIHRIGRTGRAGKEGLAFSLVRPGEAHKIELINEFLDRKYVIEQPGPELNRSDPDMEPEMITLSINGGRREKVSPGDLLGTLTSGGGLKGGEVGKIDRLDRMTYFAVHRNAKNRALNILRDGKVKGRRFKVATHDS